jgi:hypothetical protein
MNNGQHISKQMYFGVLGNFKKQKLFPLASLVVRDQIAYNEEQLCMIEKPL